MTGTIQTGPAYLVIELIDTDAGRVSYRLEALVVAQWGLQPKPGAVWVLQSGRTPDTIEELVEHFSERIGKCSFVGFTGPAEQWPYRP